MKVKKGLAVLTNKKEFLNKFEKLAVEIDVPVYTTTSVDDIIALTEFNKVDAVLVDSACISLIDEVILQDWILIDFSNVDDVILEIKRNLRKSVPASFDDFENEFLLIECKGDWILRK